VLAISTDISGSVFSISVRNLWLVHDQELTFSERLDIFCRAFFFSCCNWVAFPVPFHLVMHFVCVCLLQN